MASPEEVAKGVQLASRYYYYGIHPEVGAYIGDPSYGGYSNLEPWPMYQLIQHTTRAEKRGTAYFLTVQVGDGTPPVEDRNANRLANSCGPPIGHPTLAYKVVNADNTEYIMLRVMRTADGKLEVEGMIKGSKDETAAHAIEKDTWVGVTQSGNGRDHGIADTRPVDGTNRGIYVGAAPSHPAMSNKELEDQKMLKAAAAGVSGSSM